MIVNVGIFAITYVNLQLMLEKLIFLELYSKSMTMKKLFTLFLTSVALISCTEESVVSPTDAEELVVAQPLRTIRSPQEALSIADDAATMFGNTSSRGGERRAINVTAVTSKVSRGGDADTLLYVVNYENSEGFAIISAPDDIAPVIGVAEVGTYDENTLAENENFAYFMGCALSFVEFGPFVSSDTIPTGSNVCPTIAILEDVPAKVKVRWGQLWPEGALCPNGVAGCANTAIAQALSYYEMPTRITLSYTGLNLIVSLPWAEMKKHHTSTVNMSDDNGCAAPPIAHTRISQLCRQLGELAGSDYSQQWVTWTYVSKVRGVLMEMLPDKSIGHFRNFDGDVLKEALRNGVCLVNGSVPGVGGHMWLSDGFSVRRHIYSVYDISVSPRKLQYRTYFDKTYFHYNWGAEGGCNGYFLEDVFSTQITDFMNGWYDEGVEHEKDTDYQSVTVLTIQ